RSQILLPDRQSAELAAAARRANPAAINELPLEFIDDTLSFHAEWVVDKIAPRPILFITTDDDRLVPAEESEALFAKAGEPKKLVTLRGFGHYEVYVEPAFSQVMAETKAWFGRDLPHVLSKHVPRELGTGVGVRPRWPPWVPPPPAAAQAAVDRQRGAARGQRENPSVLCALTPVPTLQEVVTDA